MTPLHDNDASVHGIPVRHERVTGDGVDLHVVVAGEGPPVVLLHGFPENWRSWQHQFAQLTAGGFSAWAVDLRGYNGSDRPAARDAYHLRHLVADVAAVVRATGWGRAHVCGHDWGGVIAWTFAGVHPALVNRLVICNAPHMEIYVRRVRRSGQALRSWYVLLFLLPRVPEAVLSARGFLAVRRMFADTPSRPGAFSDEDIDRYVAALATPGALTAALNYYRANAGTSGLALARSARIAADTLVLWGDRDPALAPHLLRGLEEVAPRVRIRRMRDVGHWIQNEAPGEVGAAMTAFLSERA